MRFAFDAHITEVIFDAGRAAFALGDGAVRWEDGAGAEAHNGPVLCAAPHPGGSGLVTGGDDGRVVWSQTGRSTPVAALPGKWVDALAVSPASGLIAFAAGREVHVRDAASPAFARKFDHQRTVAALAFDPKGRRLAAATYGGVALWYARIAEQAPVMLRWAGSHIGAAFSPDGKFLISSMQEAALHGWRLSDAMDMRMGGYPSKIASLAFVDGGRWMATSGAAGVVLWPFSGSSGPMGKQAAEIGAGEGVVVTRVAGSPSRSVVAAGLDNGTVWVCDLGSERIEQIDAGQGAAISALAVNDSRLAWGDEAGGAGIAELPDF
jgi:WD40 repeat protein